MEQMDFILLNCERFKKSYDKILRNREKKHKQKNRKKTDEIGAEKKKDKEE